MAGVIAEAIFLGPADHCLLVHPLVWPTYFSAVPTIYARLAELPEDVRPDTSSVQLTVCEAAPVPMELLARTELHLEVPRLAGCGLTEGTCACTVNPVDDPRKPGTVGVEGKPGTWCLLDGKAVGTARDVVAAWPPGATPLAPGGRL
ncbi:AMP-binding protein [Amycolatopsis sp. NPDC051372]|uniref:AMP-binding protein n=1 Tax=Amycolatopsis sp. NPDC051372 TaxID=3155669 RepID=UPI003446500E